MQHTRIHHRAFLREVFLPARRGENSELQTELEQSGGTTPAEEAPELRPEDEKN